MKKNKWAVALLVMVLVLGLASLLVACGEEETTTTAAPATTATTAGPTTTAAPETTTTAAPETTTTAAGVPDTGQTYDLKFAYGTPSRASLVEAYLTPWTDSITAVTNGRVKVTHYPEDSLVKSEQLWDALLSGTTDIALIEPEFNAGVFPISECGSLPQLFPDAVTAAESYWDVIQEYAKEEWKDVQVLGVTVIAASQYAGNKEVKVPADMAGMRMRSGGKIETWIVEAVGATPVEISTGDLATSIERGVADGAFVTYSLMLSTGLKDVTKYRTEGNYFYRCWVVAMNKDVWESMPALMQDSIMSVSGKEASALYTTANEKATMGAKKAVEGSDKGAGNPPIYVPTAEEMAQWHEALMPVWDKWIAALPAGTDGQAVIDAVAEFNKANSAQ
jgi:TRAP-type C4-dicarboxylate transport system substrate-binding protein